MPSKILNIDTTSGQMKIIVTQSSKNDTRVIFINCEIDHDCYEIIIFEWISIKHIIN